MNATERDQLLFSIIKHSRFLVCLFSKLVDRSIINVHHMYRLVMLLLFTRDEQFQIIWYYYEFTIILLYNLIVSNFKTLTTQMILFQLSASNISTNLNTRKLFQIHYN